MAIKNSKIWGTTTEILKNPFIEIHRAEILKGGVCSDHFHSFKINAFYVESGKLLIRQFLENGMTDETTLESGDLIEIMPNIRHQFEGLDNSMVWEYYYPVGIGNTDITRFSQGYMKDEES